MITRVRDRARARVSDRRAPHVEDPPVVAGGGGAPIYALTDAAAISTYLQGLKSPAIADDLSPAEGFNFDGGTPPTGGQVTVAGFASAELSADYTAFTVATAHPENVAPAQELLDAETVEEAERAARYRARIQHAPLVTLYPRANPTRRPWDPVTWTDATRYSTARQGWVHRQAFALDPLTGHFREELQIKIDAFPETAP